MVRRVMLMCLGLAILPTSACGQSKPASPDSTSTGPVTRAEFDELARSVQTSTATVNQLSAAVTRLTNELATGASGFADTAPNGIEASGPEADRAPTLYEIAAEIRRLKQDVADLAEAQQNHITQLGQIAMQGEPGQYHWRFDSKSTAARQQFHEALRAAAPEHGYLIVNNRMGADQFLYVDGDGFRVKANDTRRIPVRRGTIETSLPGQERVLWTIVATDYQQSIDIRPRQTAPTPVERTPDLAAPIQSIPWPGIRYAAN